MKRTFLFTLLVALLSMSATVAMGQKRAKLEGIWQMCFYVSGSQDSPGTLRAGNTFKILTEDGHITNFTVIPGRGAIITGVGTYKEKNNVLRESVKKNIHLPMLEGQDNDLQFTLSENGNIMSVKFFVKEDTQGNIIDAWYYETWRRVEMPAEYPQDLVR